MSVRVMALVWQTDLPPNLRYTLLAYADHANDEGESVYPGEDRMVRKTGYSKTTIRRNTADLIKAGMLRRVKAGHRGQRAEFAVEMDTLTKAVQYGSQSKGSQDDPNGYQDPVESLVILDGKAPDGDTPNHQEPSLTITEPSRRKRDLLWEAFVQVHGEPATTSERGKYNATVKKLREAQVSPEEYPLLVSAYCSKYGNLQPAVTTVAERIGEMRHYVQHGPIRARSSAEIEEEQRWRNLTERRLS